MTGLRDVAHAKLNLTLEVLGRRGDGYHELRSLVAFAELGDALSFEPERGLALVIDGPFAGALEGDNLITAAAEAAKALDPGVGLGRFHLDKTLPVAAGLGGGSADAAAALRLLARANPGRLSIAALEGLAASLGADVTACLGSRPALMTGRGEQVTPVEGLPALRRPPRQSRVAARRKRRLRRARRPSPLRAGETAAGNSELRRQFRRCCRLCRGTRQRSRAGGGQARASDCRSAGRAQPARRRPARQALRERTDLLRPVRQRR